jgi:phasin family protein
MARKATDVPTEMAAVTPEAAVTPALAEPSAVVAPPVEVVSAHREAEHPASATAQFNTATAKVKANMDKAIKTAEDMVSFGQGNFEAMVKSGQIWAAGIQDLGKQVAATAQAQVDQTLATWKAMATAKSLKEAVDLQASLARATVEKAVAETGKLTDASMKLAEQTFAPITARISIAAERFGRAV